MFIYSIWADNHLKFSCSAKTSLANEITMAMVICLQLLFHDLRMWMVTRDPLTCLAHGVVPTIAAAVAACVLCPQVADGGVRRRGEVLDGVWFSSVVLFGTTSVWLGRFGSPAISEVGDSPSSRQQFYNTVLLSRLEADLCLWTLWCRPFPEGKGSVDKVR